MANINGTALADVLTGTSGDDVIHGLADNDTLLGKEGNDQLFGDEDEDTLDGGDGDDILDGGSGIDTARYTFATAAVEVDLNGSATSSAGNDTLIGIENASGSAYEDTVIGTGAANLISGGGGNDLLLGEGGEDRLYGQTGHDIIRGGDDDDQLYGGADDDFLNGGFGDDLLSGGAGWDRASYAFGATAGVTVDLNITGVAQDTGSQGMDLLNGIEHVSGTRFDDILTGDGGDNWIWGGVPASGGTGNDTLSGGGGNDLITVGPGTHLLNGGSGTDTLSLLGNQSDISSAGMTVSLALQGAPQDSEQGMMNLSGFENLSGSIHDDVLTGDGIGNLLAGDSGNDRLNGDAGADILYGDGRVAVDTHDFGGSGPIVTIADVNAALGEASGNDVLVGGAGSDGLFGGGGSDTLYSNLESPPYQRPYYGNPIIEPLLDTGTEVDTLSGGAGGDLLFAGYGDNVDGGDGDDALLISFLGATSGVTADFRLAGGPIVVGGGTIQNVERIEWLEGSAYGDFLAPGDGAANFAPIYGRGGDDHIVTGYYSGDTYGGAGDDLIDRTGSQYGFYHYGEDGDDTIIGGGAHERLDGGAGNDILNGNYGFDDLYGGADQDVLDGGSFGDNLYGESGNDTLYGAGDADRVEGGDGDDLIYGDFSLISSAGGLTPASNDDTLLGGAGDDTIYGDEGNDVIGGGVDDDILEGGTGDDLLEGFSGDDIVRGGDGDDTLYGGAIDPFAGAAPIASGNDILEGGDGADWIAGQGGNDSLDGGADDDTLFGGDGNDVIDGGLGADAMTGGTGDDIYHVDNVGDTVTEVLGVPQVSNIDEVRTALGTRANVYVLPDLVENLTGTSAIAQAVQGNALSNVITMGAGNDLLVLDSGGNDIASGGNGNDFFYYGAALTAADKSNGGAGVDTIGLLGSTSVTFAADSMTGIERMALYTGLPSSGGSAHAYSLTLVDQNVAAGAELFVTAASLQAGETLFFNGGSETAGRFTILSGAGNDTIVGGGGSDYVAGGAGADTIYGLAGADTLYGGVGGDQLRGGGGGDFFRYQGAGDSVAGSVDRILDFQHVDRIDLSAIDANGNAGDGNSAFTFVGSDAFHHVAGELRAYQAGADWFVEGDVNGDGLADLVIQVTLPDATPLVVGDFIL